MRMMMIDELLPGMVVAQDVVNAYDTVVVAAGVQLTAAHLKTLANLDVDYIFVDEPLKAAKTVSAEPDGQPRALVQKEEQEKETFENAVFFYKKIYEDARYGRPINSKEVEIVVGDMIRAYFGHDDLLGMLRRIQTLDVYEYIHGPSVCIVSIIIGKWLKLKGRKLQTLAVAAYLSDIGKSKISQDILKKSDKLNEFERVQARRHVSYSINILEHAGGFAPSVIEAVASHHERLDGGGYPHSKSGDDIPLKARIIGAADIFHALISKRPYRDAYTVFETAEILWNMAYKELDPVVAERLIKYITTFYVGRKVVLSDGRTGEIVLVNPYERFKPLIKVEDTYIDLSADYSCRIIGDSDISV